jgi:sugar lactone lactonase YvrE
MMPVPATEAKRLFEPATESDRFLPEGPREIRYRGRDALAWVNIQTSTSSDRGSIHVRPWETGEVIWFDLPGRPGFLLPTVDPDRLFVGMGNEVGTFDLATSRWTPLAEIPDRHPRATINDGEVVPGGRAVVFGTKDLAFRDPIAALYLWTADDNRVSLLRDGQTCSNGKIFTRDGRNHSLYDIDTPTRTVVRYRYDLPTRSIHPDGTALDLTAARDDYPDGMIDAGNGRVIVAFYNPHRGGPGEAVMFDLSTGQPIERWVTPGSPRVTCPLLVRRPDGVKLVLTTADEGMPPEVRAASPGAGCLFVADTTLMAIPESIRVRLVR